MEGEKETRDPDPIVGWGFLKGETYRQGIYMCLGVDNGKMLVELPGPEIKAVSTTREADITYEWQC